MNDIYLALGRRGEVDLGLTQFLTGNGDFEQYLTRIKKVGSCLMCGNRQEPPEHVCDENQRLEPERLELQRKLGVRVNYWRVLDVMRESERSRETIAAVKKGRI